MHVRVPAILAGASLLVLASTAGAQTAQTAPAAAPANEVSASSGAITITAHKPDLSEFGGYADMTLTDPKGRNFQGAINVPIIKDVLAVRAAAVIDQSRADHVTSIHNNLEPRDVTSSEWISVCFEPTDTFNANVTYQHIDESSGSTSTTLGDRDELI